MFPGLELSSSERLYGPVLIDDENVDGDGCHCKHAQPA